jgi:hypothetical protein
MVLESQTTLLNTLGAALLGIYQIISSKFWLLLEAVLLNRRGKGGGGTERMWYWGGVGRRSGR